MNSPKVSIGMPVYNGELFIREALDSLLAQTFTDFELIISDNCSTDGTEAICREYADKDSRIRYVRQAENQGATANFKFVLDEAVGEYFMWAAADDVWGKEFILQNFYFLEDHKNFIGSITNCSNDNVISIRSGCFQIDDDSIEMRIKKFLEMPGANCRFYGLWHRTIIKRINIIDYNYLGGDWAFIVDLLQYGLMGLSSEDVSFFKKGGISSDVIKLKRSFSKNYVDKIIPYFELSVNLFKNTYLSKIWSAKYLLRLNICFMWAYTKANVRKFLIRL